MMQVYELIQLAMLKGASDVHLSVGSPPTMRVNGGIEVYGTTPLNSGDLITALEQTTNEKERRIFEQEQELDYGFSIPGQVRLRCNAAIQRRTLSLSIRLIPLVIPTLRDLNLPEVCQSLA